MDKFTLFTPKTKKVQTGLSSLNHNLANYFCSLNCDKAIAHSATLLSQGLRDNIGRVSDAIQSLIRVLML